MNQQSHSTPYSQQQHSYHSSDKWDHTYTIERTTDVLKEQDESYRHNAM
jgi:hypothetical protein